METEALYVTDAEIIKQMKVGINAGRKALQQMRQHPKFPPRTIGGKRYWPAVRAFLDLWNGLTVEAPGIAAGQENSNGKAAHTGRRRPGLEATQRRLGRSLVG